MLIIAHHHRAPNQTIQQSLCLFTCDPARHNLKQMNVGLCSTSRFSDLRPGQDQYARVHLRIRQSRWKQPKSGHVKRKHRAKQAANTFHRLWIQTENKRKWVKEKKRTWRLIQQNCVGEGRLQSLMLRCAPPVDPDGKKQLQLFLYQRAKGYCFILLKYVEKINFLMYYFGYCSIIITSLKGLLSRFSVSSWQELTGIIMPLTQTQ